MLCRTRRGLTKILELLCNTFGIMSVKYVQLNSHISVCVYVCVSEIKSDSLEINTLYNIHAGLERCFLSDSFLMIQGFFNKL